jgi:copper(I)-binding protein
MDKGVMKMREVKGGLEIKPGETVELKPGGYHLMFVDLKEPLAQGQRVKVTLQFEKAGSIAVDYAVEGMGAGGSASDGGGKMKMGH